jgi:DNA-binding transcriptional MerR regulator
MLYSIGDLAKRTGLTVKAIRFYSDQGIVPPTDRSPAGYRRYGMDAVARLDLICTLRELGLDLRTIRKVLDREVSLAEVAAAHADALAVQIRVLRLRRAVLTAVAKRGLSAEEIHKMSKLSDGGRQALIDDFLGSVLGDHPAYEGIARSMTPELPDDPAVEQVEAWVELAELSQDPDFRASMRRVAEQHAADRASAGVPRDAFALVRAHARLGLDPASPEAEAAVAAVAEDYARLVGQPDGGDLRRRLLGRLEAANDPRRERYEELLAVVNGWPPPESLAPVLDWFIQALRSGERSPTSQRWPNGS